VVARTLEPTADAYVRAGVWATTNAGSAATLQVKKGAGADNTRRTYIKFDISDVTDSDRVTLRLHGNASVAAAAVQTLVYAVGDSSWDEPSVTWNSRPAWGRVLGSLTVEGTVAQWAEVDITRFVQSEKRAGRTAISVALRSATHTSAFAVFHSRETGSTGPRLVMTPADPR
jgi:hypothetical protein